MFKKLGQPFPDKPELIKSLVTIFWVGVFVALFLFLIQPFGIVGNWGELALYSIRFGAVTVVFGWTFEFAIRYVFRLKMEGEDWTLGKWMILSVLLLIWIAVGNYLMVNWLSGWRAMGYFNLIRMIGYTAMIGIFPVALSGILIQLRAAQKNETSAKELSKHFHPHRSENKTNLLLETQNGQQLKVDASSIRFVEAMQNYVTVWYLKDGKVQKEMLRSTIAAIETQLQATSVLRCHRSYLVNSDSIEKVSGNAQGLRLELRDVNGVEVPVSRSYIPKLRAFQD